MPHDAQPHPLIARRRWRVRGRVQGVGFRPFIFRLAEEHGLSGFVRNDAQGVLIEAQGPALDLEQFAQDLAGKRPLLAVIDAIESITIPSDPADRAFHIQPSTSDAAPTAEVSVDTSICGDCLADLRNRRDRRFGYGLTNCTNCGPRYSIIRKIPYDRPNTTMASFAMCPACRQEYENPADRRFHAQPTACPLCGPRVYLVDPNGREIPCESPIARAADMLLAGQVLAIKGLGGFHLAVRSDDEAAVGRLRRLKKRDRKPLALMMSSLKQLRRFVEIGDEGEAALLSPNAPIILAQRQPDAPVAPSVAPGVHRLGVMLPYTPIHHLLFAAMGDAPPALVMTSGNLSDEPLATDNAEAIERLGPICDALLMHDRPIERCIDDSVLIDLGADAPIPVRRARGYVPTSLPLPGADGRMGLAVGGELKNTVAVVREGRVILSQHLGDLTHPLAFEHFQRAIRDLCDLFAIHPAWIAHDLHPLYLSTVHAQKLARDMGAELVGVQHHHAHAAAVLAEHREMGEVLAVVCDGVGYGTDGSIWGGELLRVSLHGFERLAHLRPLRLPGGDAAARDTRRCGLALLHHAYGDSFANHPLAARLLPDPTERQMLATMIRKDLNCAPTTGAGRWFDGMAALLGLCGQNEFEAQAPMALEAAALQGHFNFNGPPLAQLLLSPSPGTPGEGSAPNDEARNQNDESMTKPESRRNPRLHHSDFGFDSSFGLRHSSFPEERFEFDFSPLIRALADAILAGRPATDLAAEFHEQFARGWALAVRHAVDQTGLKTVALSGGVFCNQILTQRLSALLRSAGLRILRHQIVPPNDGGLALGQAAIAAARR